MSFSIRLPAETEQRLERYCRAHGVSKTQMISRLIEKEVTEAAVKRTPFQLAESAGLVGSFDGPVDLATEHRRYSREKLRNSRKDGPDAKNSG